MDNFFRKQKILFLGTGYYDYERAIIEEMERIGAFVTYYIVIKQDLLYNILWYIPYFKKYIPAFYKNKLTRFIENDNEIYDYVFVIKGEFVYDSHLSFLREKQKNAIFLLYLWDEVCRSNGLDIILPFFDKVFSFDKDDVRKYNFIFRPLFFRPDIKKNTFAKRKYDVSFVGIMHTDRLYLLKLLRNYFINKNYCILFKILVGKIGLISLLFLKQISTNELSLFCIKKIPFQRYCKILSSSKYVVDIQVPTQSGLTMRTIEALAAGCFLITTNKKIVEYTDISSTAYFLLNRDGSNIENFKIKYDDDFSYKCIEDISIYSLNQFIYDIFK